MRSRSRIRLFEFYTTLISAFISANAGTYIAGVFDFNWFLHGLLVALLYLAVSGCIHYLNNRIWFFKPE
ncbi:MAG: hypothetical protein ACQEQ4_10975 [Fibrobacterota bacterium]